MILISLNEERRTTQSQWEGEEGKHPHFLVRISNRYSHLPIDIEFQGNGDVIANRFITKGEARKIAMAILSTIITLETETED